MANHQQVLNDYVALFENMKRDDLVNLDRFFTSNAHFKDPFNDVHGLDKIRHIFEHMFTTVKNPSFRVDEALLNNDIAYIKWQFSAQINSKGMTLVGISRVVFNQQGLVSEHSDYWDASEQFYMKLPIIGALLRFIQRQVSATKVAS
ncbi:MAG: nuclear transport factor 2 family protein [Gammaproteobacteria bacterium]|nr:nuclear transport factor 2 family protein [Gammaproteobacteria bacterium]